MPKEERFFGLFDDLAKSVSLGADLLAQLVNDHSQTAELRRQIEETEHAGDHIIHEIANRLNRSFITPFDHEDIHNLAGRLDDILDNILATADRMHLYEAGAPTPEMAKLAEALAQATKVVEAGVHGLRDMKNAKHILRDCIEIHRLENLADDASRIALAKAFASGDALYALKWKEIYDHIEVAIDTCENVATIIEGIVVKHT